MAASTLAKTSGSPVVGTDVLRIVRSTTSYQITAAHLATYMATAMSALALSATTIELGHASDTTISRASAGRIAVEGSNVLMASDLGVTVQAYDADLAAWAGVNPSSYSTTAQIAAAYQPLDADLTSWASVTRASGFDTFAATPSSANLAALVTDETGSGALVFGTSPTITSPTLSGTVAGSPTFSGNPAFSGTPSFSGVVTHQGAAGSNGLLCVSADQGSGKVFAVWGDGAGTNELFSVTRAGVTNVVSSLTVNGNAVPTISSADTLSNKTIASPTLSGTMTGGTYTGTFSGALSGTISGSPSYSGNHTFTTTTPIVVGTADTGAHYMKFTNNGGNAFVGLDSSAGGALLASSAYDLCILTESAQDIVFGTTNTERMRIASGGSVTVGGNAVMTVAGGTFTGTATMANNVSFRVTGSGADVRNAVKMTTGDVMEFATTNNNVTWNAFTHSFITPAGTALYIDNASAATFSGAFTISKANARAAVSNTSGTAATLTLGADSGAVWLGSTTNCAVGIYTNSVIRGYFGATGGLALGAPTGGDRGEGTLNCAADIYKNNTAFTNPDYVFEHFYRGNIVEFAANDGASEYAGLMTLDNLREFTRKNLRLPQVPKHGGVGIFERGDYLLRATEENTLYILSLHERIAELEQKLAA